MNKIFWVDMEMTGLNPEESVILEFAGIVTGLDLVSMGEYQAAIYQPPEELEKMNEWNRTTHSQSGLLSLIPNAKPLEVVEEEIIVFIENHFDEEPILAGNSIHQDRKFIDKYMKRLSTKLHYRMIDVSSLKLIFKHFYDIHFTKANTHRAFEDINASINELKHYLSFVNPSQPELQLNQVGQEKQ